MKPFRTKSGGFVGYSSYLKQIIYLLNYTDYRCGGGSSRIWIVFTILNKNKGNQHDLVGRNLLSKATPMVSSGPLKTVEDEHFSAYELPIFTDKV